MAGLRLSLPQQPAGQQQSATAPLPPRPGEAQETAAIQSPGGTAFGRGVVSVLGEFAQPENIIPAVAEAVTGVMTRSPAAAATVGRIAQVPGTAAQVGLEAMYGKPQTAKGAFLRLGKNLAINEAVLQGLPYVGKGLGAAGKKLGLDKVVSKARGVVGRGVLGKPAKGMDVVYDASEKIIDDLHAHITQYQTAAGRPITPRVDIESAVAAQLPTLRSKGFFSASELASGRALESLENVTRGTSAGRLAFGEQEAATDIAFATWPELFAAQLGKYTDGPEVAASLLRDSLNAGLKRKALPFKTAMNEVEAAVGKNVVPIDETLLDGMEDAVSLYAKTSQSRIGKSAMPDSMGDPIEDLIGVVEVATGKKFNASTNQFDEVIGEDGIPIPGKGWTFSELKKLRTKLSKASFSAKGEGQSVNAKAADVIDRQMEEVLRVYDDQMGLGGTPDALTKKWKDARDVAKETYHLEDTILSRATVIRLDDLSAGRQVVSEIWPADASPARLRAIRDLMGGANSEEWKAIRRWKMEELLEVIPGGKATSKVGRLAEELFSNVKHSTDYWNTWLGPDNYKRLKEFHSVLGAKASSRKQYSPLIGQMVEAGLLLGAVRAVTDPTKIPGAVARTGGYLIGTRQLAEWMSRPNESKMLMALLGKGLPKQRRQAVGWLRRAAARAAADAAIGQEPEVREVPVTVSREDYGAATGKLAKPRLKLGSY